MDPVKKEIRKAFKQADSYIAWRSPLFVWCVTLFDKDGKEIEEFYYPEYLPKREKVWIYNLLEKLDAKKEK